MLNRRSIARNSSQVYREPRIMIFFAEEKTDDSSHKLKTYGFSRLNNIKKIYEEGELIVSLR